MGNSEIYIDRQSRKEITSSGYSKWLAFNYPDLYAEKLRASNNADELLRASHDWVNEQPSHNRKDGISYFARGRVLIRIGSNKYSADVLVGKGKNGKLKLYDLLDINKTTFTEKETEYATALDPSPGSHRNTYPISDSSILSSSENSNTKFQEREDLPDDRALLMQARAEGRNAETLTAYQKKVRSLEALERKLRRQQDGLEEARKKWEAQLKEAAPEAGRKELRGEKDETWRDLNKSIKESRKQQKSERRPRSRSAGRKRPWQTWSGRRRCGRSWRRRCTQVVPSFRPAIHCTERPPLAASFCPFRSIRPEGTPPLFSIPYSLFPCQCKSGVTPRKA